MSFIMYAVTHSRVAKTHLHKTLHPLVNLPIFGNHKYLNGRYIHITTARVATPLETALYSAYQDTDTLQNYAKLKHHKETTCAMFPACRTEPDGASYTNI